MISPEKHIRYQRQMILKELGEKGQQKLFYSKVLVIGAGGLGCPALQYLTAAGVGTIGIVDFDIVDISNLNRQILYTVDDTGKSKAETAAVKLNALNPEIKINALDVKLDTSNGLDIISEYDIVIDGSDNFSTRYIVNDACVLLNKPLVYGAVLRFEGQVGVFNFKDISSGIKTNYRDLFPLPPDPDATLSCNEAGVLGVVPGIIGTIQATEAIKIITEIGKPLCNKIISINLLTNLFYEFEIYPKQESDILIPKSEIEFYNFNYNSFCKINQSSEKITHEDFDILLTNENICIIDVREKNELPLISEFDFIQIPISEFENKISAFEISTKIVIFCQTGKRSIKAVEILKNKFPDCAVFSLDEGIVAWKNKHK